ncbi:etoposide-induced protein 2.4 [Plakobranchus ocellatus]|uniref:Etoposide-induced protein 2.4 n=1 Tax=Plakobranchus ocellatus TaxID=259542 RepID=A0AAV4C379_9GAST|nr:etoposide-induced protein 2.4 [Plakobranchus ocellatus]
MAFLQYFLDDAIHGVQDSLSGWWVAVKCWRDEARLLKDKPAPPKAFSHLAKQREEQQGKNSDNDGTLSDIVWNTVTTAGVALLITFLIQTGCSFVASLFGDSFSSGLYVSSLVLHFLWWFPSMAVIKLTSIINNNEVADKVFLFKYGKPKFVPIGASISEFIFSCIYQTIFIVQAEIVCMLVPWQWVSRLLEWLHYSLFYALYAFEYKWASLGIPGHTRVAQIENNCPYYFAFGLPIHFIVGFWDSLYTRTMAFTLLFPFSILGATVAAPPRSQFFFPIHIMFPSVYVTNEACKLLRLLSGKSKAQTQKPTDPMLR